MKCRPQEYTTYSGDDAIALRVLDLIHPGWLLVLVNWINSYNHIIKVTVVRITATAFARSRLQML